MNSMQVSIDGTTGTIQPDGMVRFGSDDRMNVLFYTKSVLDPMKSREVGRPYHVSKTYVRIQQPGEKDYIDRPISGDDDAAIMRFPRQWAAYQKGQTPVPNGTPLDCLFPQNPEIAANLHGLGVHTVEQLAGLTAHGEQTIGMGSSQWKNKAKDFLAAANGGAGMHKLQRQIETLTSKMEVLMNQNSLLRGQLDAVLAEQKQGVPPAMIRPVAPTLAQSAVAAMTFSNDGDDEGLNALSAEDGNPYGDSFATPPNPTGEALFDEPSDQENATAGVEAAEAVIHQPRRRGRPPGNKASH